MFLTGYGRRTVTPDESIPLSGYSNEPQRFHTSNTEPICTTCVAISDGDTRILVIGIDICTLLDCVAVDGRERLSRLTGIPEDRIFMSATHTHSSPAIGRQDYECIQRYTAKLLQALEEAAREALADLKPSRMFTGSIETENMNFIKHYKMRDNVTGEISVIGDQYGTEKGKTYLDHMTKADPTMHLVKFVREGGKDIVLCNFRAHPHFTGGYKAYNLSSDYIGAFRMALEPMLDCHVLYLQGACGNINSSTRLAGERRYTTCRSYGLGLAATAAEGLAKYMTEVTPGQIKTSQQRLCFDIDHSMNHLVEEGRRIWALWKETFDRELCVREGEPFGIHSPYHAWAIMANYERTKEKDGWLTLNAVQLSDDLAFVTYPGELFDSVSVRMEENSPYNTTLLLGYCYHHMYYLPSMVAYKYGSYEVDTTRFLAGTGEKVADTYVEMLEELKKGEA